MVGDVVGLRVGDAVGVNSTHALGEVIAGRKLMYSSNDVSVSCKHSWASESHPQVFPLARTSALEASKQLEDPTGHDFNATSL